jgi:hypothetical protein
MSIAQRELIETWSKWVMRLAVSLCSFLIWNEHSRFIEDIKGTKSDIHEINNSLQKLESRMIRIEYELKLK